MSHNQYISIVTQSKKKKLYIAKIKEIINQSQNIKVAKEWSAYKIQINLNISYEEFKKSLSDKYLYLNLSYSRSSWSISIPFIDKMKFYKTNKNAKNNILEISYTPDPITYDYNKLNIKIADSIKQQKLIVNNFFEEYILSKSNIT